MKGIEMRRIIITIAGLFTLVAGPAFTSSGAFAETPSSSRDGLSHIQPPPPPPPGWTEVRHALSIAKRIPPGKKLSKDAVVAQGPGNSLRFIANQKYAQTEIGYTGSNYAMLRAVSPTVNSDLQRYDFFFDSGSGYYFLGSRANYQYVRTETGYTGSNYAMLRASSLYGDSIRDAYILYYNPSLNRYVLRSAANGHFVRVETTYTGADQNMLRAVDSSITSNAPFNICDASGGAC